MFLHVSKMACLELIIQTLYEIRLYNYYPITKIFLVITYNPIQNQNFVNLSTY